MADNKDDIFAKYGGREIIEPSPEEVKSLKKLKEVDDDVSMSEAMVRSGIAGATADLSIPVEAGGKAIGRKLEQLLAEPSLDIPSKEIPFKELYRQERKEVGERLKAGEEEFPIATTTASLGGGALAALIPGGAALKATKGLSLLEKIRQGATAGMKVGAAYGGLSGGIRSEADITKGLEAVPELARDVAIGSGVGAVGGTVLGGSVPVIGEALSKGGKAIIEKGKDLPFIHLPVKAFESELKGEKIPYSIDALKQAGMNIAEQLESVQDKITKLGKKYGRQVGKALSIATEKGAESDYGPALTQAKEELIQLRSNVTGKAAKEIDNVINEIDNRLLGPEQMVPTTKQKMGVVGEEKVKVPVEKRRTIVGDEKALEEELIRIKQKAELAGVDPEDFDIRVQEQDGVKTGFIVKKNRDPKTGELVNGESPIGSKMKMITEDEAPYVEKMVPKKGMIEEEVLESQRLGGKPSGPVKEMEQYRKSFQKQTPIEGREFESPEVSGILSRTGKQMKEADEIALAEVSDRLGDFYKKAKQGYANIMGSEFKGIEPLADLIPTQQQIQDLTAGKKNSGEVLYKLNQFFTRFKEIAPRLAESERKAFEKLSDRFNLLAARSGQATLISPNAGLIERFAGFAGVGSAALAGRAARLGMKVGEAITKTPQRVAQAVLTKYGPEKAKPLINVLQNLEQRDNVGRNALMFTIMQNPAYREMLNDTFPEEMKNE